MFQKKKGEKLISLLNPYASPFVLASPDANPRSALEIRNSANNDDAICVSYVTTSFIPCREDRSCVIFTCIVFSITLSIMISYSIAASNYTKKHDEPYSILKDLKINNLNRIVCAHLDINSIRNKFEQLKSMIIGIVDILIITETKLDETFPHAQFFMGGFSKPYRLDRSGNGGGILIYIRENIQCKSLDISPISNQIEIESINLRNIKWLLGGTFLIKC